MNDLTYHKLQMLISSSTPTHFSHDGSNLCMQMSGCRPRSYVCSLLSPASGLNLRKPPLFARHIYCIPSLAACCAAHCRTLHQCPLAEHFLLHFLCYIGPLQILGWVHWRLNPGIIGSFLTKQKLFYKQNVL